MEKMGEVLSLIKDCNWHSNREILDKTGISENELRLILKFFQESEVATVDQRAERVKIKSFGREIAKLPKD